MGTDCTFGNPCHRYRGLLADIDELKRDNERIRSALERVCHNMPTSEELATCPSEKTWAEWIAHVALTAGKCDR